DAKRANIPQIADDSADDSQPQQDTPETIIAALPPKEVPLPDFAPRPKADVGQQAPQNVPFAMADASATTEQAVSTAQAPAPDKVPFGTANAVEAASADPAQVAVNNIPLPTWRPDRTTPAELASKDQNVLLALADTAQQDRSATDAFSVLPTARPQPAKQDEIKAVLEQASATPDDGGAQYQLASLTQPEPRSAFNDPSGVDAASPRKAIAALPAGSDPAQAIGAGVKTTAKEARASARDLKPGPKAMVVAAPPQAARWALGSGETIATVSSATTAPRYAYNIVHTPPSEVYTAGFQSDAQAPDTSRFTGNAVKFLSVARFQTK
ncbi:MAG: peptidase M15, partial [Mesorhizobium sp.]|nr:peptidase M15 [Mesorhizobium sp.]